MKPIFLFGIVIWGHLKRALALSLGMVAVCHGQTEVSHVQIDQQLRQARYETVLTLTQQGLAQNPGDVQMKFWQALAYDKLGRSAQALPLYKELTLEHPELPEPHNNLGVLLLKQGDLMAARLSFEEALRMDAKYAQAMENLGDTLVLMAANWYQQALSISPLKEGLNRKIKALTSP